MVVSILDMTVDGDTLLDVVTLSCHVWKCEMTWCIYYSLVLLLQSGHFAGNTAVKVTADFMCSFQWNEDIYLLSNILKCWHEYSVRSLSI